MIKFAHSAQGLVKLMRERGRGGERETERNSEREREGDRRKEKERDID